MFGSGAAPPGRRPTRRRTKAVLRMAVAGVTALIATVAAVGVGAGAASGTEADSRAPLSGGWPGQAVASVAEAERLAAEVRTAAGAAVAGDLLVFHTRNARGRYVDLPPTGDSPGDFFMFEEDVFDRDGANQVGKDSVRCELGIRTFTCAATLVVDDKGKLTASGTLFNRRDGTLPVTGGTDAYEGAGGQLTVFDLPRGETVLIFHLVR